MDVVIGPVEASATFNDRRRELWSCLTTALDWPVWAQGYGMYGRGMMNEALMRFTGDLLQDVQRFLTGETHRVTITIPQEWLDSIRPGTSNKEWPV